MTKQLSVSDVKLILTPTAELKERNDIKLREMRGERLCECESSLCLHRKPCIFEASPKAVTIHGTRLCPDCAEKMPSKYMRDE